MSEEVTVDDSKLVQRVIDGDKGAYELLVIKYQSRLFGSVVGIVKDYDVALEAVQEAFLKGYRSLSDLRNHDMFYPWIKRIALNLSFSCLSRSRRFVDMDCDENLSFFDNIKSDSNPEKCILNDEAFKYVKSFVDSLPDKLRVVLVLREIEDMSYEEISSMLNIPLGTVRSRLFAARQHLRNRLIQQGLADGVYGAES